MVCYNFMPVFDWTRTELARVREDGSTVLAYNQEAVDRIDPERMFESIAGDMNGTVMPGWEPERMARVKELFDLYRDIDSEKLFENLKYFLEAVMPVYGYTSGRSGVVGIRSSENYHEHGEYQPDDEDGGQSSQRSHFLRRLIRDKS